jgi:hypothetical protein
VKGVWECLLVAVKDVDTLFSKYLHDITMTEVCSKPKAIYTWLWILNVDVNCRILKDGRDHFTTAFGWGKLNWVVCSLSVNLNSKI